MTRTIAVLSALVVLPLLVAAPPDEVREASQALEQQDYARAAGILEKLLERDEENVSLQFNLAFAYTHLGQDAKAIELYEKVVRQQPQLMSARMNLAMLLLRGERAAEALPHLAAAVEARPGDFPTQLLYARALRRAEKPEEAMMAYGKAVSVEGATADASVELGDLLAERKRFKEATEAYRRAGEIDPKLDTMVLQLAERLEGDLPQDALAIYQEYLDAHGDAVAVRERVAMLLLQGERYPEAISMLEKVIAQSATAANRATLAQAYVLNNEPAKALPAWKEAVAADPESSSLRLRYANALLYSESFAEAGQQYLEALKADANLVEAWNGLAFCLYRADNYPGALKALLESAARGSEKPGNVYLRAIVEDKLQMHKEAMASYERFLGMTPGMADEEWKAKERIKVLTKILKKR
jgi:tetratricopeptide (TPR) repeat protein